METIVIKSKTEGKFPKVTSEAGKSYGVKDVSAFQIGQAYDVEYTERKVDMLNGKSFMARDVTSFKLHAPVATAESSLAQQRTVAIKENMDFKDKGIRECAALNNATQFVGSVAMVWASTDEIKTKTLPEIVTRLDGIKVLELNRNRREFGLPEFEVVVNEEPIDF